MFRNYTVTLIALLIVGALTVTGEEKKNLAKPAKEPVSWRLEQLETGKADMAPEGDAIVITIKEVSGTDWHVQAVQTNLKMADGKEYVLSFKAKASSDRNMPVNAMVDQEDWHTIGLTEAAEVTMDWKDFKYEFKAEGVSKEKNRISLVLGGEKGKVWIKDMQLIAK